MGMTWTRSRSVIDTATDRPTLTVTTIVGEVVKVTGDPVRYRELGLRETESPTLLFVPTTYGDTVEPGDTGVFDDKTYTARDVNSLAPDGVTITSRIIAER